jgi:hypothetical protein
MSEFTFRPERPPFPRWLGPFSPARGQYSGFRFHSRRLGTWLEGRHGREFWPVMDSGAVRTLGRLVLDHWHGGRVLLLPNGFVIKPLQRDGEVGKRVLIGCFSGPVRLERPAGDVFDLSMPGRLTPGQRWIGPKTTGLECVIQADGSLECEWYHPTNVGRESVREVVCGPDALLARGFRAARPRDPAGRVRLTANGYVITNRQDPDGSWVTLYVGRISVRSLLRRSTWIRKDGV